MFLFSFIGNTNIWEKHRTTFYSSKCTLIRSMLTRRDEQWQFLPRGFTLRVSPTCIMSLILTSYWLGSSGSRGLTNRGQINSAGTKTSTETKRSWRERKRMAKDRWEWTGKVSRGAKRKAAGEMEEQRRRRAKACGRVCTWQGRRRRSRENVAAREKFARSKQLQWIPSGFLSPLKRAALKLRSLARFEKFLSFPLFLFLLLAQVSRLLLPSSSLRERNFFRFTTLLIMNYSRILCVKRHLFAFWYYNCLPSSSERSIFFFFEGTLKRDD